MIDLLSTFGSNYAPPLSKGKGAVDSGATILREAAQSVGYWSKFAAGKLSDPETRILIAKIADDARDSVQEIGRRFCAKALSLPAWAADTLRTLFPRYLGAAMAAIGTVKPDPSDLAAVDRATATQGGFLARFRKAIGSKAVPTLTPQGDPSPALLSRLGMYGSAAWMVAEAVKRYNRFRLGFQFERRLIHAFHSCTVCIQQAALGWVRIGMLLGIGEGSPCVSLCRCSFEFRR